MSTNYQFEVLVKDADSECTSTVEILVNPPPTVAGMRYWTMEETGNVTRYDSVNNDQLSQVSAIFANVGSQPGKVGNAVYLEVESASDFVIGLASPGPYAAPPIPITPASNDLTISTAFWYKLINLEDPSPLANSWVQFDAFVSGVRVSQVGLYSHDGLFVFFHEVGGNYQEEVLPIPDNNWHLWFLFYDQATNQVGYSIDNAAVTNFAVPAQVGGPLDGYWVWLHSSQLVLGNTGAHFLVDEELILVGAKLTPAQVTYLYNSGSGRTWPIVLP